MSKQKRVVVHDGVSQSYPDPISSAVDFNGKKRPAEYMVELEPESGNAVGKYGGAATIDAKNVFTFENVPPGKPHKSKAIRIVIKNGM